MSVRVCFLPLSKALYLILLVTLTLFQIRSTFLVGVGGWGMYLFKNLEKNVDQPHFVYLTLGFSILLIFVFSPSFYTSIEFWVSSSSNLKYCKTPSEPGFIFPPILLFSIMSLFPFVILRTNSDWFSADTYLLPVPRLKLNPRLVSVSVWHGIPSTWHHSYSFFPCLICNSVDWRIPFNICTCIQSVF